MSAIDGRTIAIIAYLTLIGWVIALVLHLGNKTSLGAFHLRQMLGPMLTALVFSIIPVIGWMLSLVLFAFWVLGLVTAIRGEQKPLPLIGDLYQQAFRVIL
ncbi:MAG: hypothetical protein A2286_13550 [Gammaproteobacteria bacterium RIFOXYA12_FULL_61_12]|nr:MAG: hypothetical protein A2514_05020 [Gammaproteobacteria bacterium RIFOXYD12_FULL_61_37]OGT93598.1 MAG: hypothetical protein A2286_13550 [Gammaproteobacteria bacterium RIFOXYA12_FULL_61_12]